MIFNIIRPFSGVSVDRTDYGRELKSYPAKCAQFYHAEHGTISKVFQAFQILADFAMVVAPSLIGTYAAVKLFVSPSLGQWTKIAGIAAVILAAFSMYGLIVNWQIKYHETFKREYEVINQENTIIQALGGLQTFNGLNRLSADQVNQIHLPPQGMGDYNVINVRGLGRVYKGHLDQIQPQDVNNKPITVGVDKCNRPFVSVCVKLKANPQIEFVDTFFQRHNPAQTDSWYRAGMDGNVFEMMGSFDQQIQVLKELQDGTHPTHELV